MRQLEAAKREARKNLKRFSSLPHNSQWRKIISEMYRELEVESPEQAYLVQQIYLSGVKRSRRPSYAAFAQYFHVSEDTIDVWLGEIVTEAALRAARKGLC